jgi:hypothetical protein
MQTMRKRTILAASSGLLALAVMAPPTQAADRFAVTCLYNHTNYNVGYMLQWGSGQWERHVVRPRAGFIHRWKFDYSRPNVHPRIHLRFDDSIRPGISSRPYTLHAYSSPDEDLRCRRGKKYNFVPDGKGYIDVRSAN